MVVHASGGTWQYKNLLNCMYWCILDSLLQFCTAELESAWRPVYLITIQAILVQSTAACPASGLVTSPALFGRGVSCCCFLGGTEAASAAGARAIGGVNAVGSTVLVLASWEDTGTDAVLVTYLLDKGLAAGLPSEQDFLRMFLVQYLVQFAD
jgi:hypothetical protein